MKNSRMSRELFGIAIGGATKEHPRKGLQLRSDARGAPKARADKGVEPFFPTKVALIFDRCDVVELVRRYCGVGGRWGPHTPLQTCAWLLAIFRKIAATWYA